MSAGCGSSVASLSDEELRSNYQNELEDVSRLLDELESDTPPENAANAIKLAARNLERIEENLLERDRDSRREKRNQRRNMTREEVMADSRKNLAERKPPEGQQDENPRADISMRIREMRQTPKYSQYTAELRLLEEALMPPKTRRKARLGRKRK